jgi:arylsulfatase
LGRYFNPKEHHIPQDWNTLISHNDLELYDTLTDPHETNNLAKTPEQYKDLILTLNNKLNYLIEKEIGLEVDNGGYMPGLSQWWQL